MIYGLDTRLFVENGAAVKAAEVRRARPTARFRAWQGLDAQSRFQVVEKALKPANDFIDSYPLAL